MAVTLKYSDLSGMGFAQAMQKITNIQFDAPIACRVRRTTRAITEARDKIREEYKTDIVTPFCLKDDSGKPVVAEDGEGPGGFKLDDTKKAEFDAAQKAFGDRIATLDCFPFTCQTFQGAKLSAAEIESLKGLFLDDEQEATLMASEAPGIPRNVQSLR